MLRVSRPRLVRTNTQAEHVGMDSEADPGLDSHPDDDPVETDGTERQSPLRQEDEW